MRLRLHLLLVLFSLSTMLSAQWDIYEASWDNLPGKMMVHMDWDLQAPLAELPFIFETQMIVDRCADGFPVGAEYGQLDTASMFINQLIGDQSYVEHVGKLYYQCMVKDFFYVQDTTGLKAKVAAHDPLISTKVFKDAEWKVYKDFIYPDPFLEQTMINGKIINQLGVSGIDSEAKLPLTHVASFASSSDLKKYQTFVLEQNFKVVSKETLEEGFLPHRIYFSRKDKPKLEQLSNITLRLTQRAEFLEGSYGGWAIAIDE